MNKMNSRFWVLFCRWCATLLMASSPSVYAYIDMSKTIDRPVESSVDPRLNIEQSTSVDLDISVTNFLNNPVPSVVLKIYAVEASEPSNSARRELKTSLISIVRTDLNGNAQRTVEVPPQYHEIKIIKMMEAARPEYHVRLEGQERVVVNF